MPAPQVSSIPVLPRGVHLLPFFGPKGEWLLVAVSGEGREVARVSADSDAVWKANDRMWAALYRSDPR